MQAVKALIRRKVASHVLKVLNGRTVEISFVDKSRLASWSLKASTVHGAS